MPIKIKREVPNNIRVKSNLFITIYSKVFPLDTGHSEMLQEKENSIGKLQSNFCLFYKFFGHITCLAIQKLVRES